MVTRTIAFHNLLSSTITGTGREEELVSRRDIAIFPVAM
jgi:hypothetical protein